MGIIIVKGAEMEVIQVKTEAEFEAFYALAESYVDWMLAEIAVEYPELDRQSFRREHGYDDIRKKFAGGDILFLAKDEAGFCGCVALGKLNNEIAEMRTMFVQAQARGKGAGRHLAEATMSQAKSQGFRKMRLDTLGFMKSALSLYRGLGFYEIDAYIALPEALKQYIRFLECDLG
jgi:GNAT superfamily N-acetyltransferase